MNSSNAYDVRKWKSKQMFLLRDLLYRSILRRTLSVTGTVERNSRIIDEIESIWNETFVP
jgi:hypothetical protein